MSNLPDYDAMEKEYSKIKPMTVQGTPFFQDSPPNQACIKPLIKLYAIYSLVDQAVNDIVNSSADKELPLLVSHLSKKVINNVITLLSISPLPEKECLPKLNGYSAYVRFALMQSAKGCCSALEYVGQIPYLKNRLSVEDIFLLHSMLLTLTAF